jgi:(4S)-4-hydroxy-5-phosphonooxypentane-2,3-dione isomerase
MYSGRRSTEVCVPCALATHELGTVCLATGRKWVRYAGWQCCGQRTDRRASPVFRARIDMYVVIVEFIIEAAQVNVFRERVRQQARDSLAMEADCHVFDVCIDPERPERVLLYEVYSDAAAFDTHLASAHFIDFDSCVRDWLYDKKVARWEKI